MTRTEMISYCLTQLNIGNGQSAGTDSTTSSHPAYSDAQIARAVDAAVEAVVDIRANLPDDPLWQRLRSTSSPLAHGALLPNHIGRLGGVRVTHDNTNYYPGRPLPPHEVQHNRDDVALFSLVSAVEDYAIERSRIWHTGTFATVEYVPYPLTTPHASLDGGDALAACHLALASLFPLEGGKIAGGQHYMTLFFQHFNLQIQLAQAALARFQAIVAEETREG
jgi:hypothetical protein